MWLAIGHNAEHQGAIRLDIRPVGDVVGDISAMPFKSGAACGVELHHVLEHIERDRAGQVLSELRRVLWPGGSLHISVPDILKCAQSLLNGNLSLLVNIYSPDPESAQHHRWGYTPETLNEALTRAGFVDIVAVHDRDAHSVRYYCRRPI